MRAGAVAASALLFLACGGGSKHVPAPRTEQAMIATIDEAVALLVEIGEAVMSAEDDCELMARKVNGWLDANGERLAYNNARLRQIDRPDMKDAYRQRLSRHLDVVRGMQVGVEGCEGHAGFMRAWKRLDG